ncbi:MAG: phosphate-starvation-inducible PsiE family protein [Leptolyngbyaceae cyanobacterium CSU_1_4]|nr:phosphate-starvation-inducible PsiE family protein [Leptolyngbyaceae cyanobacterium CSU_1_4]
MGFFQNFFTFIKAAGSDENFLVALKKVETWVSKILSIAMVAVLLTTVIELCIFLTKEIIFNNSFAEPDKFFSVTLIKIFGLFLNVLIALEVLENITAYLKKHVVQLELVVVTSLTAVARKIIIFDFTKATGFELIALAASIFALSISYWIIRRATRHV